MTELTIGREEGNSRLKITTADGKVFFYGNAGSVPKSVSRQHCKLQVNSREDLVITNIKPENKTLVNGLGVMSKHISVNDQVELGRDKYLLSLMPIVNAVLQPASEPSPNGQKNAPAYSIVHLKEVWEEYSNAKLNAQIQQARENSLSTVTGLFSMAAIMIGFFPGVPLWLRIVVYAIGFGLAGFFFYKRMRRTSYYPKLYNELDEKLHKKYVCPNPDCQRFLGYQPYDDLKKMKKCYTCGCEYKKS